MPFCLFFIFNDLFCLFLVHPLPTWLFLAKSLQEFAAVLQNLEDERTRMVSDLSSYIVYIIGYS